MSCSSLPCQVSRTSHLYCSRSTCHPRRIFIASVPRITHFGRLLLPCHASRTLHLYCNRATCPVHRIFYSLCATYHTRCTFNASVLRVTRIAYLLLPYHVSRTSHLYCISPVESPSSGWAHIKFVPSAIWASPHNGWHYSLVLRSSRVRELTRWPDKRTVLCDLPQFT
jgi:hypothetical protein